MKNQPFWEFVLSGKLGINQTGRHPITLEESIHPFRSFIKPLDIF